MTNVLKPSIINKPAIKIQLKLLIGRFKEFAIIKLALEIFHKLF